MSKVSFISTPSYEDSVVYAAVCRHFQEHIQALPKPGMRVLIKPNLLSARRPSAAVTTHHSLIAAVIRCLHELGITDIVVADSPGGLYNQEHFRAVCSAAGLTRPETKPYLNRNFSYGHVKPPVNNPLVHSYNIITPAISADYIINMPKLKTHAMTTVSAGVKNLFGMIPGLQKPDMHRRFPDISGFSRMLCELAVTIKPDLTILDAVDSMEGNGPGGGTVKHTGYTFASTDVFALDVAACLFMGLTPSSIPHLDAASNLSLLPESIEYSGDSFTPCPQPFMLPDAAKSTSFLDSVPRPFRGAASKVMDVLLRSYPHVDRKKCVGCGKCAESCPQKIISITGGKAAMPRRGCISCFCCQEMCPAHAIVVRRGLKNL